MSKKRQNGKAGKTEIERLGAALRDYREKNGFTLQAVAALLKLRGTPLSVATLFNIEKGRSGNIRTRALLRRLMAGKGQDVAA
ncbi:MAG: helix-turn-helix domain-containing protein [Acidobacteria bacterium]|nr:helix-turn-helix domain-containing protein [Acidobacteriota bacterium]